MTLFGTCKDLPLADFLHLLESNRLTGKVTVTTKERHGVVVLRRGRVIYAATNGPRETMGSMLVHRGLISPSTLAEALARQARSKEERRLGSVLLEMGEVQEATLHELMHEQVGRVLKELIGWRDGFVRFEPLEIPERGEIAVDARDFLLQEGLATERVLFNVMTRLGTDQDDTQDQELLDALTRGRPPEQDRLSARDRSLKQIMMDIRSPRFTGEVTLDLLRVAGDHLDRGALFLHGESAFVGVGQFGFGGDEVETGAAVREIRIPSDEPSILHDVAVRRQTYVGPFEYRYWNVKLARQLGEAVPDRVAVVPLLVNDQVHMLLYGDNVPSGATIEQMDEMEVVMLQAGLAIEKAVLEQKLEAAGASPRGPLSQAARAGNGGPVAPEPLPGG